MQVHGAHRFVVSALALGALARSAFAADEWPPKTAPRVPGDATPPAVVAPAPVPVPAPVAPTPAPAPEPELEAKPAPEPVVTRAEPAASPVETVRVTPAPVSVSGPLYGLSGNRAFARTSRDEVVLFPGGLLQLDAHSYQTKDLAVPDTRVWLNRARPELAGWLGRALYFNAAADFAHGPSLRGVDDYVAVAPWRDRAILQVGQFDAPFMFENQTRDRDLDFLERSIAVRGFAIPENKKRGAMVHGTTDERNYYFAAGAFMSDGQKDAMGRAWVAPFSFRDPDVLRSVTVGGSAWVGDATASASLPPQTTSGSVIVLEPSTKWLDGGTMTSVALRPQGRYEAAALELDAPLWHRTGVRFEWVAKHQPLVEASAVNGGKAATRSGFALGGWATYGEAWYWILGNDRVAGTTPGLALPVRLTRPFGLLPPLTGVMVAARVEHLDETVTAPSGAAAASQVWSVGATTVTTARLGVNVWFAARARLTLDYAWNRLGGTTLYSTSFTDPNIQELSVRLALAL
jgi:hypothetical protein